MCLSQIFPSLSFIFSHIYVFGCCLNQQIKQSCHVFGVLLMYYDHHFVILMTKTEG